MGIESPVHLLFIAVVALVVLGPKRLPALARALGQGIREFRESLDIGASGGDPHTQMQPAASAVSAPAASSTTPAPVPPPHPADATAPDATVSGAGAPAPEPGSSAEGAVEPGGEHAGEQ